MPLGLTLGGSGESVTESVTLGSDPTSQRYSSSFWRYAS